MISISTCVSILCLLSASCTSGQASSPLKLTNGINKRLVTSPMTSLHLPSISRCLDECMYSTSCLSVNYVRGTGLCELLPENSTSYLTSAIATMETNQPGYLHADISEWLQMRSSNPCSSRPCGTEFTCFPNGNTAECRLEDKRLNVTYFERMSSGTSGTTEEPGTTVTPTPPTGTSPTIVASPTIVTSPTTMASQTTTVTQTSTSVIPTTTAAPTKKDVVFVLQTNSMSGETNFQKMRDFVAALINSTSAGVNTGRVQFGLSTYHENCMRKWFLDKHSTVADYLNAIPNIDYDDRDNSDAAKALQNLVGFMSVESGKGARPNADKVGIILQVKKSNMNSRGTAANAMSAWNSGIHIYGIGIGLTDASELESMVTAPIADNTFYLTDYDDLVGLETQITL